MTTPRAASSQNAAIQTMAGAVDDRSNTGEEVNAFIAQLLRLTPAEHDAPQERSRKRAALAALRRGLGKAPGAATEMLPYIVPILPENAYGWREQACYLVASLFALYRPERGEQVEPNFGVAYLRLIEATKSDSTERRFLALLDAPRDSLPDHLRHAIGQMAATNRRIPIDWRSLLKDILSWDADDRWVQRKWAKGFYTARTIRTTTTDSANHDAR